MLKGKLDIKMVFILILAGALILSFIFRPSKTINTHEDEIEALEKENESLLSKNDSLTIENAKLDEKIQKILIDIDSTQHLLDETNDRINDLENDKGKISSYVKSLDADGVANSLTEYLNKRTK